MSKLTKDGTCVVRIIQMETQPDVTRFNQGVEYGQALAARDLEFLRAEVNHKRRIIADQNKLITGLFTGLVLAVGTLVGLFFWSQS